MNTNQIISAVAEIHNRMVEIRVCGDDAIRMAEVLQRCRSLVFALQEAEAAEAKRNEVADNSGDVQSQPV